MSKGGLKRTDKIKLNEKNFIIICAYNNRHFFSFCLSKSERVILKMIKEFLFVSGAFIRTFSPKEC